MENISFVYEAIDRLCSFYLRHSMNKFFQASTNGNCVWEKQVCQRLAPPLDLPLWEIFEVPLTMSGFWLAVTIAAVITSHLQASVMICVGGTGAWLCAVMAVAITMLSRSLCMMRRKMRWRRLMEEWSPQIGQLSYKDACRRKFKSNRRWRRKEKSKGDRLRPYDPQLGFSVGGLSQAFTRMAVANGIPFDDDILDKIENLGALYLTIRESTSTTQMCGSLFLYFKTLYKKSVAMAAAEYLAAICELEFSPQSGEFTTSSSFGLQEADKPKWLRLLKECKENWTMVIRNDGFKKISQILSLSIALGLCESSKLDFRLGGMKLFSIGAEPKHASAIDLVDAVFETIVYFAEGGYMCFERGSIKPLLYGNMENEEFESNYGKCQQGVEYAKAGNLKMLNMDDNDFELLMCSTIEKCQSLIRMARGGVEKNILQRKLDMLRMWQTSFRQTRVQGGLRSAPYSIGIYGTTGVGKSSVANIMMVTTLLHNGFKAGDEYIVTMNETDKYMSNYRSYINGILLDDIGNTKPGYVERAPTSLMIQLVNNVRTYANMAEADMKGKVSVEPKVVVSTKNVKDTCATIYSNEPASIARRDRITLTVSVKPEFCSDGMLDFRKVQKVYGGQPPLIPDLWNILVERAIPVPNKVEGKSDTVGWETIYNKGVPMDCVSIHQLIRYVAEDSKDFYSAQKVLVENQNNMASKFEICKQCNLVGDICTCNNLPFFVSSKISHDCPSGYCANCEVHHDDESYVSEYSDQLGELIALSIQRKVWRWKRTIGPRVERWFDFAEMKSVDWMLKRLEWFEKSPFIVWTNWVPTEWLSTETFKHMVWVTRADELDERIAESYRNHLLILLVLLIGTVKYHYLCIFIPLSLMAIARVKQVEEERLYDIVVNDNKAMPAVFKMYRDKHVKWITGVCVTIGAAYALACVWKALRVVPDPQGNLAPTSEIEIKERDDEVNPWAGVVVTPMPASEKSKTTDIDTLEAMVAKNLAHMLITHGGKKYHCDAFFPCSNVALVPQHMWMGDNMHAKFTRHDSTKIGGNFEAWLYKGHSYNIPDTDLSLVWVPNGGDWKDLSGYFPLGDYESVPARLVYKKGDGSILKIQEKTPRMMLRSSIVNSKVCSYQGHKYTLGFNTFEGLCMAVVVTETRGPVIGGFHLSGINGTPEGASGVLDQKQLSQGVEKLREKKCVVVSKSEGEIPTKLYDVQFYEGNGVHPKSAINFMPEGTNVKYYGQCTGRASYYTSVFQLPISSSVTKVTGVVNKWAGPKFGENYPFQASLQHSAKPSLGIEGNLLEWAVNDYCSHMINKVNFTFKSLKRHIRPLAEMENLCGIDGLRFIDKIPSNTSKGFPLSGPKSDDIELLDPSDFEGFQSPAQLDKKFWKHAYEMEELYLQGKRGYPIFKACLKDEPTKIDKNKVRVFQGAPLAFQLLIRKYFLPIARVLSMMPLDSECAVGVNAQGPEWDQLARHVKQHGADRILAGDYSKYDLRMPAQVMFCAFRVMMDIARECGEYSNRDFTIMEGIAADVCYPLMAYNGDLIQHIGSNPSGHNLTVYVNSIVNSLLFRCAFKSIVKKEKIRPFREVCSLMTYGDDAKSSVSADYSEFNHLSVAKFLADHDMKFTMPDKESMPTPYMKDEDADFLKRKNVFSQDTGMIMAALDEDSIFKSLHSALKSKILTPEQQAMQNIDGALREWFFHGRETYEKRREQMQLIASETDLSHGCTMLHRTYDDQLLYWKEKYIPT